MSRGICVRCGENTAHFDQICPSCGHRPEGEGLQIAWLLSEGNLDEAGLARAQERIRSGEPIRPSQRMLDKARRALGVHFATDEGMTVRERLALLVTNVLVTPLVGWVLCAWWVETRPRAALQAAALTLPVSALFMAGVIYVVIG